MAGDWPQIKRVKYLDVTVYAMVKVNLYYGSNIKDLKRVFKAFHRYGSLGKRLTMRTFYSTIQPRRF